MQAAIFWGLIFCSWLSYPADHRFSIFTHTFSFLGSYNPEHNPRFWWLFSVAMVFWGVSAIPVIRHLYRSFARLSRWGAAAGAGWMALGCLGLVLVGLFPDVRAEWRPGLRYTEVHTRVALLVAAGFGTGFLTFAVLTFSALLRQAWGGMPQEFPTRRAAWPLLFWLSVSGTSLFMVLRWAGLYAQMKIAATAAGRPLGSAWAEGLKTWYAFPLWENLAIYALYLSLAWLAHTLGSHLNS